MRGNDSLGFLDVLTIFSVLLQVQGYEMDLQSASNDDILKELKTQDNRYFRRILENQEKIIHLLENSND